MNFNVCRYVCQDPLSNSVQKTNKPNLGFFLSNLNFTGAACVLFVSLSAGWDGRCSNICLAVMLYGVFEGRAPDVTLESGDLAGFRCQMNLDRNHSPCVCLQRGTWSREGLPGHSCPGSQLLLSPQVFSWSHSAQHHAQGVPQAAPSKRWEGPATGFVVASVLSEFKTGPFSSQSFFPTTMDGWMDGVQ